MKKDVRKVFWHSLELPSWGTVFIAASNKGYCYVGGPNESFEDMEQYISKHFSRYDLVKSHSIVLQIEKEMMEFLQGKRLDFSISLDLKGTEFQQIVWDELKNIPYGKNTSYTQVAKNIERPRAVRAVASAIGANPISIVVPCHRVIAKNGKLGGYRGGLKNKKKLLQLENETLNS